MTIHLAFLVSATVFLAASVQADVEADSTVTYLVDSKPIAQTPKHLGVNVEIQYFHDESNIWDWLAFSGTQMAREIHPDKDMRFSVASDALLAIRTQDEFETYRQNLLADPDNAAPWQNYRFDRNVPWVGEPDGVIRKVVESGVSPLISMAYTPIFFPRPLITEWKEGEMTDAQIDWGAAASAYEYYFLHIWRFASREGVTHYCMLNEPFGKPEYLYQIGLLARFARLAMEDVRTLLNDKETAKALWLSGPACHHGWEEIYKLCEPHLDSADFHFYDAAPELFRRKLMRGAIRTHHSNRKFAMSEFNRIGMRMQPDESTHGLLPALELAHMLRSVLTTTPVDHKGFEFALLYQFQAPATHRNFKSLVYGDMNYIDWSIRDRGLRYRSEEWKPDLEALQLRFPTPSFFVFKMFSRCTPGTGKNMESYEVLGLGESVRGFTPARDQLHTQNISKIHNPEKFYANNGVGPDVHTAVVRTQDQLIFLILNAGPTEAKGMGFNLELLENMYAWAVVREFSLERQDMPLRQFPIQGNGFTIDAPPESLTQVILTPLNLGAVEELRNQEHTTTPGRITALKQFQTTQLRVLGRIGSQWHDLTNLNVHFESSCEDVLTVYQGGLIQRVRPTNKETVVLARTLNGVTAAPLLIPPDAPVSAEPFLENGGFETPVVVGQELPRRHIRKIWTEMVHAPVQGWFFRDDAQQWARSEEYNHTPDGKASIKLSVAPSKPRTSKLEAHVGLEDEIELTARRYRLSAWVLRPELSHGLSGIVRLRSAFNVKAPVAEVVLPDNVQDLPAGEWVRIQGEIEAPHNASLMRFQLIFEASENQEGALFFDDVEAEPLYTDKT